MRQRLCHTKRIYFICTMPLYFIAVSYPLCFYIYIGYITSTQLTLFSTTLAAELIQHVRSCWLSQLVWVPAGKPNP